jgi:hypothetical protein
MSYRLRDMCSSRAWILWRDITCRLTDDSTARLRPNTTITPACGTVTGSQLSFYWQKCRQRSTDAFPQRQLPEPLFKVTTSYEQRHGEKLYIVITKNAPGPIPMSHSALPPIFASDVTIRWSSRITTTTGLQDYLLVMSSREIKSANANRSSLTRSAIHGCTRDKKALISLSHCVSMAEVMFNGSRYGWGLFDARPVGFQRTKGPIENLPIVPKDGHFNKIYHLP